MLGNVWRQQLKKSLIYTKKSGIFSKRVEIEQNHYDVLGLSHDSDFEKIKEAYYVLAKKYHPDLNKEPKAIVNLNKKIGKI
jgi:DnaJ-class molecular chaperone